MKAPISQQSGYQMIVGGNIPKLTVAYLKKRVIDREVWSSLFVNDGKQALEIAIRRHLSGLGANVTSQVMAKFQITDEVVKSCRNTYSAY